MVGTHLHQRKAVLSVSSEESERSIRMSSEEERAVLEQTEPDEATEPADEGVGVHTDAADDQDHTQN